MAEILIHIEKLKVYIPEIAQNSSNIFGEGKFDENC
jgi:hypothetical protein